MGLLEPLSRYLTGNEFHHLRRHGHAHQIAGDRVTLKLVIVGKRTQPNQLSSAELPAFAPVGNRPAARCGQSVGRGIGRKPVVVELCPLLTEERMSGAIVFAAADQMPEPQI